jgi:PE family
MHGYSAALKLPAAAGDLHGIGSAMSGANSAAASTTDVRPAESSAGWRAEAAKLIVIT